MTLKEAYEYGQERLNAAGIEEYSIDAWYLLEFVTGLDRTAYFLKSDEKITDEQGSLYKAYLEQRAQHIPLQHITGVQEFMGLEFAVNEHVLVPRQDTEILVECVLSYVQPQMKVLDMCTGSGCILLSLLKLVPGLTGTGVDISGEALKVAVENGKRLQTEASFLESDLFEKVEGSFGLIVSNPPYIASEEIPTLMEEVRDHEPIGALDGSADGLEFYRRLVREGKEHVKPGGWMLFEIGCTQAEAVMELLKNGGFLDVYVKKDLAGLERVVGGRRPKQEERNDV